jgi:hypothetical protein
METKDYIIVFISGSALILSLFSLIVTLVQKNKETKRTIRKTLTDTIENITKINIEVTKLKASKEVDFDSEPIILLRRNFNSQRRALVAHADFLVTRNDKLTTEIDCNILAGAYAAIGDQDKAEYYWQKTVDKSSSLPIKVMNLRGFGTFLFGNEKEDLGRKFFNQAFELDLIENDDNKILKIDTYLMLCELEKGSGNSQNYDNALIKAMEVLSTIKHTNTKTEMHERISRRLPSKFEKPNA